jgi:hypothetical protein
MERVAGKCYNSDAKHADHNMANGLPGSGGLHHPDVKSTCNRMKKA